MVDRRQALAGPGEAQGGRVAGEPLERPVETALRVPGIGGEGRRQAGFRQVEALALLGQQSLRAR